MPSPLSRSLSWDLANSLWASTLNPFIQNPVNNILVINNVSLITGVNIINHRLGAMQNGWMILDIQGSATIYRSAPFNSNTLQLTSSAAVTINLGVF